MEKSDGDQKPYFDAQPSVSSVEQSAASTRRERGVAPERQSRAASEEQLNAIARRHGVNRARLMLKCDLWIVLPICILYLLAFLDRVNISNAQVYGLSKDLKLKGQQYNTALTVFFVPYVVFEIPSNYLLKLFKPHVWLSACMLLFGAVSIGQGFVHSYGALITTRVLLGVLETGMFPGCFYLLSMWYRRDEAQKRYSFFFSSTSLAGAFGGLIAYGMSKIDGKKGLASWRWLFIVEGAITCVIAIILFFVIADFPEDARFLSANEREYVKEKLALDAGDSQHGQKIEIKRMFAVFKDWKVWAAGVMYFSAIVPAYSYAFFAPTIIKTFGYSAVKTQVYSIFPWICSFGTSMLFAIFSDLLRHRFGIIVLALCCVIVGFGLEIGLAPTAGTDPTGNGSGRYAGCFLVCLVYAAMPLIICWCNMNFAGHYRKMVGSAWQVGFGNIGGIVATYLFPAKDNPRFRTGFGVCLAMACFAILVCSGYLVGVWSENRARREGKQDAKFAALPEKEKQYAGDKDPRFVYNY